MPGIAMPSRSIARVLLLWAFALCGCAPIAPAQTSAQPTPKSESAAASADYTIGPEDVLEISVWKEEALKKDTLVRPDGGISFPLVGELQAAGKTTLQLQQELTQRLAKYIPKPVVSVSILKSASYKVYVVGKVNKAGEFTLGRRVDVLQALSMAGGLTPYAAANQIRILRKVEGKDVTYAFDYNKVEKGIGLEQNILLKSGDTVIVP
jgi:polysaccharide biosynthesis/export protein